jgi:hypothetical protein
MASALRKFRFSRNEGFPCENCGLEVQPLANGSCRNHCPRCLSSKHVDHVPGDRASRCGGLMECVAVESDARRGWMLVHRCTLCGSVRRNRAALDDARQPDDFMALLRVARVKGNGIAFQRSGPHGAYGIGRRHGDAT